MATSGVKNRVQMRKDMYSWLKEIQGDLDAEIQEAALKAAIAGIDAMRETVDTTPSDLSRTPKDNRNWTGHMRSLIDSDIQVRRDELVIRVGWLKLSADDQYILIQEKGGSVQGKVITAMNALGNGTLAVRESLERDGYR